MLGMMVVAVWFALVAAYLVRQWWEGELAIADCGLRIGDFNHRGACVLVSEVLSETGYGRNCGWLRVAA